MICIYFISRGVGRRAKEMDGLRPIEFVNVLKVPFFGSKSINVVTMHR